MAITIEYQPSLIGAGNVAYQSGLGRFRQDQDRFQLSQDQLGEQARQFDQRMDFSAQEAALRDDQLRRQMGMQAQQFGVQTAQRGQAMDLQRMGMVGRMEAERMQQEGWERKGQQELEAAEMRENSRLAQVQQTQQFQNAMSEKNAIMDYITKNGKVLGEDGAAALVSQWEEKHAAMGLPWGFDTDAMTQAQQAVEETARKKIEAAATHMGLPDGAYEAGLLGTDQQGNVAPTPLGTAWLARQEKDAQRAHEVAINEQARVEAQQTAEAAAAKATEDREKADQKAKEDKDLAIQETAANKGREGLDALFEFEDSIAEFEAFGKLTGDELEEARATGGTPKKPDLDRHALPVIDRDVAALMPPRSIFRVVLNGQPTVLIKHPSGKLIIYDYAKHGTPSNAIANFTDKIRKDEEHRVAGRVAGSMGAMVGYGTGGMLGGMAGRVAGNPGGFQ